MCSVLATLIDPRPDRRPKMCQLPPFFYHQSRLATHVRFVETAPETAAETATKASASAVSDRHPPPSVEFIGSTNPVHDLSPGGGQKRCREEEADVVEHADPQSPDQPRTATDMECPRRKRRKHGLSGRKGKRPREQASDVGQLAHSLPSSHEERITATATPPPEGKRRKVA